MLCALVYMYITPVVCSREKKRKKGGDAANDEMLSLKIIGVLRKTNFAGESLEHASRDPDRSESNRFYDPSVSRGRSLQRV